MDPRYILIEDLMSHRRTEIDFTQFQSALIMGQLKNNPRESNGVGKTVIFHAIEYVLFGTYPTSSIDDIVRDGTDMCRVTFDFALGSNVFRIERARRKAKSSTIKLFKFNGDLLEDISQRTTTDTNKLLQQLIKINVSSFRNSVQFSQNNIDGLISTNGKAATNEDRKTILKNALNLSQYQKYEKAAKDASLDLSKKMAARKAVIESIGDPESDIAMLKKDLEETKQKILVKEKRRDEITISLSSKKTEIIDLQSLISTEAVGIHLKLSDIKNNKRAIFGKIKNSRETIIDSENKIASLDSILDKKKTELGELEERGDFIRAKKRRPLNKVKQEFEAAAHNELNGKAYVASMESQAEELKSPPPDGEDCPTCHRELSSKDRVWCIEKMNQKLSTIMDDIAEKRMFLKKATNKKTRFQNELEEINKSISYITTIETKIDSKQSEIKNDLDYIGRLKGLNSRSSSDLKMLDKELEELKNLEGSLESSLKEISDDKVESKISRLKKEISELEYLQHLEVKGMTTENTQLGIGMARVEGKEEQLIRLNNEQEKLENLNYQCLLYKMARKAFSSSGIPTMIINTILDDLQIEANKLLSSLKPGLEIQFTPDVDILYKYHGRDRVFSQLSGGQTMIIALSLKLGLSIIIQRRLGVDIKFLQLDEVDQSLDDAAVDAYAEAIRKLQNRFKILVITHNNALKDKFSNVILVEGDEYNGATSKLVNF